VSIEFAEQEGAAFVSGNGVSKPRGILGYPTVLNDNYAWGKLGFVKTGAAADFVAAAGDRRAAGRLPDRPLLRAEGRLPQRRDLAHLRQGDGHDPQDEGRQRQLPVGAAAAKAEVPTILQKPVVTDDNMPALGANAFPSRSATSSAAT
jgi:predicted phage gp36 major capsid-like protein